MSSPETEGQNTGEDIKGKHAFRLFGCSDCAARTGADREPGGGMYFLLFMLLLLWGGCPAENGKVTMNTAVTGAGRKHSTRYPLPIALAKKVPSEGFD